MTTRDKIKMTIFTAIAAVAFAFALSEPARAGTIDPPWMEPELTPPVDAYDCEYRAWLIELLPIWWREKDMAVCGIPKPRKPKTERTPRPEPPKECPPVVKVKKNKTGNPGNDKPVGKSGEKADKGMAERGDAGNRGKSN